MTDIGPRILYHFKICILSRPVQLWKWFYHFYLLCASLPYVIIYSCGFPLVLYVSSSLALLIFFCFISMNSLFIQSFFISFFFFPSERPYYNTICVVLKFQCRFMQCFFSDFRAREISLFWSFGFLLISYWELCILLCSRFALNAWKISIWFCAQ